MSYFLIHEPCPSCGSRDNVARYSDGHCFCFGCGYNEPASSDKGKMLPQPKERSVALPGDFQRGIPPIPYAWLKKYELTPKEIWENNIGWSESMKLLIFPCFNELGEIVVWQGRNFREGNDKKYLTYGKVSEHFHILKYISDLVPWDEEEHTITICEDIISAIKINRIINSMPLFGSHVSNKLLNRLSKFFTNLIVWLDPDKQGREYKEIINKSRLYFTSCKCIISEKDPKEYNTTQMKEIFK